MDTPLVSIITPAYKCKDTIKETYESIKSQTFSSWEWIVTEDNSNDGTYEYIKELVKNDSRVVLLQTEKNGGAAVARNTSIEKARGKYIAFLDSDDLWEPEKLEKQIKFMEDKKCAFSFTNYYLLYENGTRKTHREKKDFVTYKQLLKSNYIGCLTAMYDASFIGKVYMPLDSEKREDHAAWLDITKKGFKAYRLDEYLATYRIASKSVSSSKAKMAKYQYRLYRKHEGFGVIKSLWYVFLVSLNKIFNKY